MGRRWPTAARLELAGEADWEAFDGAIERVDWGMRLGHFLLGSFTGQDKVGGRNSKGNIGRTLEYPLQGLTLGGDLLEGSFEVGLNFPAVAIEYQWDGQVEFMGEIPQRQMRFPALARGGFVGERPQPIRVWPLGKTFAPQAERLRSRPSDGAKIPAGFARVPQRAGGYFGHGNPPALRLAHTQQAGRIDVLSALVSARFPAH